MGAQVGAQAVEPAAAAGAVGHVDLGFAAAHAPLPGPARASSGRLFCSLRCAATTCLQAAAAGMPARSPPPRRWPDGPRRRRRGASGRADRSKPRASARRGCTPAAGWRSPPALAARGAWRGPGRSARPGARRRRVQVSCSGSRASCGTVKGRTCSAPISIVDAVAGDAQQAFEVGLADGARRCLGSSRPGCARAAPAGARSRCGRRARG